MSVLAHALFDGDVAEWLSGRCGQCDAEVYIELRVRVPLTAGETVGTSRFCEAHWRARAALRTEPREGEREHHLATLRAVGNAASGWEPEVCLVANSRAGDIAAACRWALAALCDQFRAEVFAKAGKADPALASEPHHPE